MNATFNHVTKQAQRFNAAAAVRMINMIDAQPKHDPLSAFLEEFR